MKNYSTARALLTGPALLLLAASAFAGAPDNPGIQDGQGFGQARSAYASSHGGPRSEGQSTGYHASSRNNENPVFNGVGQPNSANDSGSGNDGLY